MNVSTNRRTFHLTVYRGEAADFDRSDTFVLYTDKTVEQVAAQELTDHLTGEVDGWVTTEPLIIELHVVEVGGNPAGVTLRAVLGFTQ